MKHLKLLILCTLLLPALLSARTFARWHTSMGSFTAELYDEIVPITANNFKSLANAGFYNNLIFHRVIERFMIQDGCPNGTGTGGPGYTIQDEFSPLLNHNQAGILAMARTSAPNSAGSQYYITLQATPHLNGNYAVFGKILEGLENVLAIGSVATGANDRPITPVNIYQLRMLDLQIGELYPPVAETLQIPTDQSTIFMVEAYTELADMSFDWYVDDVLLDEQFFMLEHSFPSAGDHSVHCHVASSDSISFDVSWNVQCTSSNADIQAPGLISVNTSPNPFSGNLEISYSLKIASEVEISLYNLKGQKLRSLHPGAKAAGSWTSIWDGKDAQGGTCPAGLYILKLSGCGSTVYRKLSKI